VTVTINFPNSPPPNNGDIYTPANGITYTYINGKWKGLVSPAYKNKPLTNLNLEGGIASSIFEIDMAFVDCGGSIVRGVLAQDRYDGDSNGSTTSSFDKFLDGGQA